jgi:hypothetical protein
MYANPWILTCTVRHSLIPIALFHVKCFESFADFSNIDILNRFEPLTRHNYSLRRKSYRSIVNGGAERLAEEWKRQMWDLYVPQVTGYLEQKLKDSPAFKDMYFHAGSKGYVSGGRPAWLRSRGGCPDDYTSEAD